eukprot:4382898-Lingulodinium_polyedra.AAC.1
MSVGMRFEDVLDPLDLERPALSGRRVMLVRPRTPSRPWRRGTLGRFGWAVANATCFPADIAVAAGVPPV